MSRGDFIARKYTERLANTPEHDIFVNHGTAENPPGLRKA
jgi:hypothetical protein